jgi:hypothetical protein
MVYPRINKTVCKVHHDKVGPTLAAQLLADAVSTAAADSACAAQVLKGHQQHCSRHFC